MWAASDQYVKHKKTHNLTQTENYLMSLSRASQLLKTWKDSFQQETTGTGVYFRFLLFLYPDVPPERQSWIWSDIEQNWKCPQQKYKSLIFIFSYFYLFILLQITNGSNVTLLMGNGHHMKVWGNVVRKLDRLLDEDGTFQKVGWNRFLENNWTNYRELYFGFRLLCGHKLAKGSSQ